MEDLKAEFFKCNKEAIKVQIHQIFCTGKLVDLEGITRLASRAIGMTAEDLAFVAKITGQNEKNKIKGVIVDMLVGRYYNGMYEIVFKWIETLY